MFPFAFAAVSLLLWACAERRQRAALMLIELAVTRQERKHSLVRLPTAASVCTNTAATLACDKS